MLKDRIKERRKALGMTQQDLAQAMNASRSTVAMWEIGRVDVPLSVLSELALVLDTSIAYLVDGEDIGKPPTLNALPYTMDRSVIPIVGSVRCGPGGLAYQELLGAEVADVPNPKEYFYLRAEGDSMAPDIKEGDLVLVHQQEEVESGALAVVVILGAESEGVGMLKKFIHTQNAITLQSLNPAYAPQVLVGEEMNSLKVVGRVMEVKRKY